MRVKTDTLVLDADCTIETGAPMFPLSNGYANVPGGCLSCGPCVPQVIAQNDANEQQFEEIPSSMELCTYVDGLELTYDGFDGYAEPETPNCINKSHKKITPASYHSVTSLGDPTENPKQKSTPTTNTDGAIGYMARTDDLPEGMSIAARDSKLEHFFARKQAGLHRLDYRRRCWTARWVSSSNGRVKGYLLRFLENNWEDPYFHPFKDIETSARFVRQTGQFVLRLSSTIPGCVTVSYLEMEKEGDEYKGCVTHTRFSVTREGIVHKQKTYSSISACCAALHIVMFSQQEKPKQVAAPYLS
eukprot:CAMPEP_0174261558 /NCGR_PEP_ID=MMETSP0439-20130205/11498_1 /TAXON_ID=0 /ORGANISM="Stereomyxa ramosa, Strain Chinc5" /LENGTH=301 /DNA_ID=CAMNT_0015346049 /DNA_START=65 /DNA_END=967 /DNA_ORIENTATION=+